MEIRGPTAGSTGLAAVGGGDGGSGRMRPLGVFSEVFEAALAAPTPVRFSRHAAERIQARGIQLTARELERLSAAVEKAGAKGARGSLVVSGALAYLVDVPERMVITALSGDQVHGQVFTNIDSAVVI